MRTERQQRREHDDRGDVELAERVRVNDAEHRSIQGNLLKPAPGRERAKKRVMDTGGRGNE